jgi:hypothetical protein
LWVLREQEYLNKNGKKKTTELRSTVPDFLPSRENTKKASAEVSLVAGNWHQISEEQLSLCLFHDPE